MSDAPILELPGLAGQNPLGFLAALGLLRVLDHRARAAGDRLPALAFEPAAPHRARLRTGLPLPEVKRVVLDDAEAQARSAVLGFAYTDEGEPCSCAAPEAVRDLKGPPALVARLLDGVAGLERERRRDADLAAALFCETVTDNKGQAKPTALHFTAGQQALPPRGGSRRGSPRAGDERVEAAVDGMGFVQRTRLRAARERPRGGEARERAGGELARAAGTRLPPGLPRAAGSPDDGGEGWLEGRGVHLAALDDPRGIARDLGSPAHRGASVVVAGAGCRGNRDGARVRHPPLGPGWLRELLPARRGPAAGPVARLLTSS